MKRQAFVPVMCLGLLIITSQANIKKCQIGLTIPGTEIDLSYCRSTSNKPTHSQRTDFLQRKDTLSSDWRDILGNTTSYVPFPKVFKIAPDFEQAVEYATNLTCLVKVEARDKNTRREVMPQMTIRVSSGPSSKTLESMLAKEFGSDDFGVSLVNEVLDSLKKKGLRVLGDEVEENAQAMQVLVCVDSVCAITTVHPEYYYFKGSLDIPSKGEINKVILLVETGTKVRQESVKEGDVGNMVDSE